ncbi:hypothetical protein N7474_005051 [Penicillium riverlandense]|uniref:uncharacterized protein n=1 Tax=Penicillium riverlandense TaxID=1903569 RepID=UPI002548F04A|nr:uncharacterized protein N7474_005051 [Penicillium riverlandense]KAJ5819460.1 hypothetical protein N7474_005051 [Penicillium riverlandense]
MGSASDITDHVQSILTISSFSTHLEQSQSPANQIAFPSSPATWPILPELRTAWFITPDTWATKPSNPANGTSTTTSEAWKYINKLQGWIATWVGIGSNPFIHGRLHQTRPPTCIKDAFTAVSSYIIRTSSTEEFIFQILEDRAAALIRSPGSPLQTRSTAMRIDIRQRHLAEQQLSTLRSWSNEMLASARDAAENDDLLLYNTSEDNFAIKQTVIGELLPIIKHDEVLWHSWILCESIRRTWLVSQMVYGIYTTLQQGLNECPGGIMFTTQKGAWDAPSAFSWTKVCAEKNNSPEEVDEFAKTLMVLDVGLERLQDWGWKIND